MQAKGCAYRSGTRSGWTTVKTADWKKANRAKLINPKG
jgi:hypothetical protein